MEPVAHHDRSPTVTFDGGPLHCGNGLLLLIRRHIDPLAPGELLEIQSTEISVEEDLPAWCRLTGNPLISWTKQGDRRSFLVEKGGRPAVTATFIPATSARSDTKSLGGSAVPGTGEIAPLSVMGIGSWP